ncbi:hypothetical protein [Marinomonas pollencensis]|uniref:hypothetical protein n=1 Tax=Marinomonas pollencensis TaxID=491954 RepID=UPI0015F28863|nr:hypothetical protein [Marinomonas pollencensis]
MPVQVQTPSNSPLKKKGESKSCAAMGTLRFAYDALRGESVAAGGLCYGFCVGWF